MMAPGLLVGALEIALNRYLQLEPEVLAECAQLDGRCIALSVNSLAWTFYIEPCAQGVRVLSQRDAAPDVSLSGPLTPLLRLAWSATQNRDGLPQGLAVEGDVELLSRFNSLLRHVGFDPEELLARYFGDAGGHRLHHGLKALLGWGRSSARTLGLDAAEYLREETGDLARAADVADWTAGVDRLRDAVDRFEARLDLLEPRA